MNVAFLAFLEGCNLNYLVEYLEGRKVRFLAVLGVYSTFWLNVAFLAKFEG